MTRNDLWTHVGLVVAFFVAVVAPRLLSPGHTVNSVVYIAGGSIVIAVAAGMRRRTQIAERRGRAWRT